MTTNPWFDDYQGRLKYAASVISAGRETSRRFDSCFENYDGDAVAVALYRRAQSNPRLASNLYRYLDRATVQEAAAKYAGRNLTELAQHLREAAKESSA